LLSWIVSWKPFATTPHGDHVRRKSALTERDQSPARQWESTGHSRKQDFG
jgi:hypothetical protein